MKKSMDLIEQFLQCRVNVDPMKPLDQIQLLVNSVKNKRPNKSRLIDDEEAEYESHVFKTDRIINSALRSCNDILANSLLRWTNMVREINQLIKP